MWLQDIERALFMIDTHVDPLAVTVDKIENGFILLSDGTTFAIKTLAKEYCKLFGISS